MDYKHINKESWNKRTEIHVKSDFYNVKGFLSGNCTLNEIELNEIGDINGKSLLHLQCHFGLDTLSWARRGAKVTGVDLSSTAIEKAREIASKSKLDGQFICADLYEFEKMSETQYDIVFTSYGVLCWLPDLDKWAKLIANNLKSGGTFYIAEFHPFYDVLSGYNYFHQTTPDIEQEGTYTENDTGETSTLVTWAHSFSDIINALISNGLIITKVNEYDYSPYNCFSNMFEQDGKFYLNHHDKAVPLVFSIKAIKK